MLTPWAPATLTAVASISPVSSVQLAAVSGLSWSRSQFSRMKNIRAQEMRHCCVPTPTDLSPGVSICHINSFQAKKIAENNKNWAI